MNKKIGCWGFLGIAIIAGFAINLASNPFGWVVLITGTAVGVYFALQSKKNKEKRFQAALTSQAFELESIAAGNRAVDAVALAMNKDERILGTLPKVALTEYQSTGSSYSGANAGVSFPLFGSIRGHVGGQGGQITRNPEELLTVDYGRAIFTNQRILFSGAKYVRDWDLSKVVNLEIGPNGYDVKIAVTNHERTSGLQAPDIFTFGPGYLAAFAFNWSQNGSVSAKKWAKDLGKEIRTKVAAEIELKK